MPMYDADRRPAATRHTNAAAAFTLLAAVFFIGGAVSFGTALEKGASPTVHAVAAAPLVAGSLSAGVAYASRKRAAALRRTGAAGGEPETTEGPAEFPPSAT